MYRLHVSSEAVLGGEVFVAFIAIVVLFPVSVNHDLVSTVIRDRSEVLIALVATVKNSSVFMNG